MTTFPDLRDVGLFLQEVDHATITLPIRGKEYTFSAGELTIRAQLRLQQARAQLDAITRKRAAGEQIDPYAELLPGVDEDEFAGDLIGAEMIERMADDAVKVTELTHLGLTLFVWHLQGEEAALAMWRGEMPSGDADPPAKGSVSTRTAGSSTRKPRPAKPRSAGQRSSRTGTSSNQGSTRTTKST